MESDDTGIIANWVFRKNFAEEVYLTLCGKEEIENAIKAWEGSPGMGR